MSEMTFGDFVWRIARRKFTGPEAPITKAALAEDSGATGGYTVPRPLLLGLLQDVSEHAIVRPRALVVPMQARTLDLPLPTATVAQAAGVPPYWGGIDLRWSVEGATRSETAEPTFRLVSLEAWELSGYALISRPLLDDAQNLEPFLRTLLARAVAWAEDYAFLAGVGGGKPTSMLASGAAISVTRAGANDFVAADASNMVQSLLPSSWPTAIWVMHPSVFDKAMKLATWQMNVGSFDRHPGSFVGWLDGRPVFASGSLPALGTKGDVMLIDPSLYVIGDRQRVDIDISLEESTAFLKNQAVLRVVHRVGGQPWFSAPITLADGTKTASPIVVLN